VVTDAMGARNSTAWRSNPDHNISIGDTLTDVMWKMAAERGEMELPTGPTRGGDLLPTPNASDGTGGGQHPDKREGHSRQLIDYVLLLQTPQARDGEGLPGDGFNKGNLLSQLIDSGEGCCHPADARLISDSAISCGICACHLSVEDAERSYRTQWGKYEPAIRLWEQLTRPAPPPTEPNKNGNPRLAAAFSEWLMGWPQGWVTDPAIGISRNDQLRIVGNGVVPQQAAAALRYLMAVAQ
jgi:DNA (cytosine-5)-methyltransferase 1